MAPAKEKKRVESSIIIKQDDAHLTYSSNESRIELADASKSLA